MLVDIIRKGLVLGLCFGFVACSDSDDDDGNGINAIFTVTATGDGDTNVKASMLTGSSGSASTQVVDIASGDLNAFANNSIAPPQVMDRVDNGVGKRDTYETDFVGEDSLTTEFEVQYTTAPSSTVSLPMDFTIDDTGNTGTPYQLYWGAANIGTTDFVLAWTNGGAYAGGADFVINYKVISCTGHTVNPVTFTVSNSALDFLVTGSVPMSTIRDSANTLADTTDHLTETCVFEIELVRSQSGSLDPNYTNGSITGIQSRIQNFEIIPGP